MSDGQYSETAVNVNISVSLPSISAFDRHRWIVLKRGLFPSYVTHYRTRDITSHPQARAEANQRSSGSEVARRMSASRGAEQRAVGRSRVRYNPESEITHEFNQTVRRHALTDGDIR